MQWLHESNFIGKLLNMKECQELKFIIWDRKISFTEIYGTSVTSFKCVLTFLVGWNTPDSI